VTRGRKAALSDRELLEHLVGFDSTSRRSNREIAEFVADYLERSGCRVLLHDYDDGAKCNLFASRGAESSAAAALLLSGHLDVVPAEEPGWESAPFILAQRDGRFFGRGTADMKGFCALAINRIANLVDDDLSRPLSLLLTADEELGSLGAQAFVRDHPGVPLARDAIIGEPTGLRVVRMHKGHLKLRLRISGKAAHSGYPHLGSNAIEPAAGIVAALAELAHEWTRVRTTVSEHFPDCPHPVLNIATIHGGSALNIVPDACEIGLGIRLLPGQASNAALAEIEALPARVSTSAGGQVELETINDSPPMLCPADAAIDRVLAELTGQRDTLGVSFASDAGVLHSAGVHSVLFGPGRIEDAHRANESLDIAEWRRAGPLLERVIDVFCREDSDAD